MKVPNVIFLGMSGVVKQKIQASQGLDHLGQGFLRPAKFAGYLVAIRASQHLRSHGKLWFQGFQGRQMSVLASRLERFKYEYGRHSVSRPQLQALPGLSK